MKVLKYISILSFTFIIFSALSVSVTNEVESQGDDDPITLWKEIYPNILEPGGEAEVTIHVPGGSTTLRDPADTMLVMDRSGSMSINWLGKPKIDSAKDALKAFVDQTQEDGANPGDYVGLSTYSNSATLDFSIANMTNGNKTAIKTAIDSLSAIGMTSVGSGMNIANQELLNNARPAEVPKFMVLATDGRQNTVPSPYQDDILQTAIDNDIVIFTVGIGSDVTTLSNWWSTCVGCPDPNGDGFFSGEEIMKDIACRTDQHRVDPADNCQTTWNTGNNPDINDLDNPAHYFFADSPDKLNYVYVEIANEITVGTWYQLIDQINYSVLARIFPDTLTVTNCATGAEWPRYEISWSGSLNFIVILGDVHEGEEVCLTFKVLVRPDATPGDYLVDSIGLAVLADPDETCEDISILTCIFRLIGRPQIEILNTPFTIIDPAEPWLKTTGGDVGSATTGIDMARDDPPIPDFNADYLMIAGGTTNLITNFTSARGWLVEEYSDPDGIAIRPEPVSGSMYDAMYERYTKRCSNNLNGSLPTQIEGAITPDCNVLTFTGTFTVGSSWTYDGPPAVIFIGNKMEINNDLDIHKDTGLVFVVRNDILINGASSNVTEIDGIFITDKEFNTNRNVACGISGSNNQQLTINGAVYVFGEACFTRSLPPLPNIPNNRDFAAEVINYEPKYLWLFRETLGDAKTRFKEVAP